MIPKIIHYIWFGNTQNNITKKSINTWKKRAPEYEIIEWNERNLPDYENEFYQKALSNKDYAFASDYARLRILQQYGGIYMDTDMYLLKDPHKILTNKDLVFGIQDKDMIFSTSFIASAPNQEFIRKALKVYEQTEYTPKTLVANTELLSPLMFETYGFKHVAKTQVKGSVVAYSPKILLQPSFNAVAIHIGTKTWTSHSRHDRLRIKLRQHIKNQFEAGIFSLLNSVGRHIF
jgi:mannosyltransferase OCH1-like enzyme